MATTNPLDDEIPTTKWYRARPSRLAREKSRGPKGAPCPRTVSSGAGARRVWRRGEGEDRGPSARRRAGKLSSAALAAEVATAGGGAVRAADLARLVAALALALGVRLVLAVERLAELRLHVIDVRLAGVLGRAIVRMPGLSVLGGSVLGGSVLGGSRRRGVGRLGRVSIGGRGGLGLGR